MFLIFFGSNWFFGLKTAKSFQCTQPLYGAPGAKNEKKIAPSVTKNIFLKPQRKKKRKNFDFFGSNFFVAWGPEFL